MAYDLFRGASEKNFAIQGHPPIHSFEYVMAGGGYTKASPKNKQSSSGESGVEEELRIPQKQGLYLYEISNSDWEAVNRWMNNIDTNVKYTRQVHGSELLSDEDVAKFDMFWKRWLAFKGKINAVEKSLKDESLASKILSVTSPVYWASRLLYNTIKGSMALMSADNKRELDALLSEAWKLYNYLRSRGMSQVPIPYMGELVMLLRSLPPDMSLSDMANRLRDAARAGERLVDVNTAWWQWRIRSDTKTLLRTIDGAQEFARDLARVAKLPEGQGLRDSGSPVYVKFVRTVAAIYGEAAALYGSEEVKTTARAEAKDVAHEKAKSATISIGWIAAMVGAGYLGIRWLTQDKVTIVVENQKPGYHPDNGDSGHHHEDDDSITNDEGDSHGL